MNMDIDKPWGDVLVFGINDHGVICLGLSFMDGGDFAPYYLHGTLGDYSKGSNNLPIVYYELFHDLLFYGRYGCL